MKGKINGVEVTFTPCKPADADITVKGRAFRFNAEQVPKLVNATRPPARLVFDIGYAAEAESLTLFGREYKLLTGGEYAIIKEQPMKTITINSTLFTLTAAYSDEAKRWAPIIINDVRYDVDNREGLRSIAHSQADKLTILGVAHKEITILDRVWVLTTTNVFVPKAESAKPFPHVGQVVSLYGTDVEVLHIDRGIAFWYNPIDGIHGMTYASKLRPSQVATLRADLDKGLGAKELIALGWRREL